MFSLTTLDLYCMWNIPHINHQNKKNIKLKRGFCISQHAKKIAMPIFNTKQCIIKNR